MDLWLLGARDFGLIGFLCSGGYEGLFGFVGVEESRSLAVCFANFILGRTGFYAEEVCIGL